MIRAAVRAWFDRHVPLVETLDLSRLDLLDRGISDEDYYLMVVADAKARMGVVPHVHP